MEDDDKHKIHITVEDTGIGIPQSAMNRYVVGMPLPCGETLMVIDCSEHFLKLIRRRGESMEDQASAWRSHANSRNLWEEISRKLNYTKQ